MANSKLEEDVRKLLNAVSQEDKSNTPDYILAKLLMETLATFETLVNERDRWFGRIE